eukprot:5279299-Pyramimonas_sp.AAC.1
MYGEGFTGSVAGKEASFVLETFDPRGEQLLRGGAVIEVTLQMEDKVVEAKVKDLNNGKYKAAYMLEQAGVWELKIKSIGLFAGDPLVYVTECEPGEYVLDKTLVDVEAVAGEDDWIAGDWAAVKVSDLCVEKTPI